MKTQAKLIRVGGTQAVVLPVALMRERGWKIGDVLEVQTGPSGVTLMDHDTHKSIKSIVRRLVRDNLDTVKWLAKR